jgi:Fe-S-cluster-containing hydrogenase component 2
MCARNCPQGAIVVENNLAIIDYEKCTGCGTCKEKCPAKCIL